MTFEPRITVGVPVYNGERFLDEALGSLAGQTFRDLEVIILDNASVDGTAAIAADFVHRDARFHYRRHPSNIGPVANFNALVRLARAPLFKWLAADDSLQPEFLERCVRELETEPALVLATTRLEVFGEDGRPLIADASGRHWVAANGERVPDRPSIARLLDRPEATERFRNVLHRMFGLQISTYMYGVIRTDVLRRTGLEGPYPGGDKVLLAELALHGRFRELPDVLWSCRIHPQHLGALPPAELERMLRPGRALHVRTMRMDQLRGYVGAIRRAPVGNRDRVRCMRALVGRGRAAGTGT